jgi:polar amino acid transport system permease protein
VSLLFPPTGIPALVFSLRSGRLVKEGRVEEARVEGERARDWCWYSLGIGLAVYFVLFIVVLFTIRDGVLGQVYFKRDVITSGDVWRSLLKGFWINIQVFLWSEAIVLVWALVVAIVRLLPHRACVPIRLVATAYSDLFRALPAVLVILIINFGFQRARLPLLEHFSTMQYAILALVLVYGAYVAEVYRAGIESIHPSQASAARSLGVTYAQTMRYVVVPQAVRRVIPPLLNDFIGLQKDTALIFSIGIFEVLSRARFVNNAQATFTGYTMAAMLFFIITIPMTRFVDQLQRRDQARMRAG